MSNTTSKVHDQLVAFGVNPHSIHRNLTVEKLVEQSIETNEGMLTSTGSLSVKTGKYTGRSGLVKVGYGTPKIAYGLHPSGYTDNLVHNAGDLDNLNPKEDGIRFGHSVGAKKRRDIMKIAIEKKFKVFNARVSQNAS